MQACLRKFVEWSEMWDPLKEEFEGVRQNKTWSSWRMFGSFQLLAFNITWVVATSDVHLKGLYQSPESFPSTSLLLGLFVEEINLEQAVILQMPVIWSCQNFPIAWALMILCVGKGDVATYSLCRAPEEGTKAQEFM